MGWWWWWGNKDALFSCVPRILNQNLIPKESPAPSFPGSWFLILITFLLCKSSTILILSLTVLAHVQSKHGLIMSEKR